MQLGPSAMRINRITCQSYARSSAICMARLLFILTFPIDCWADIYRCTNAEGRLVTADRLMPECKNRLVKIYTDRGQFKSEIRPPLTEHEIREKEREQERQRAMELANAEMQKEERYLSAHYRSEADIDIARKRSIEIINGKKRLVEDQLASLTGYITELQGELSNSKKSTVNLQILKDRADEINRSIQKNQELLKLYAQELERTNREYDQTLDRYRLVVSNRRR